MICNSRLIGIEIKKKKERERERARALQNFQFSKTNFSEVLQEKVNFAEAVLYVLLKFHPYSLCEIIINKFLYRKLPILPIHLFLLVNENPQM